MAALDRVTYSLNPQVHAFDNASLVENLEAQVKRLKEMGVGEIFTPGTPTKKAVEYVEQAVPAG